MYVSRKYRWLLPQRIDMGGLDSGRGGSISIQNLGVSQFARPRIEWVPPIGCLCDATNWVPLNIQVFATNWVPLRCLAKRLCAFAMQPIAMQPIGCLEYSGLCNQLGAFAMLGQAAHLPLCARAIRCAEQIWTS